MAIEGIDGLVYGITDFATCDQFFDDWGLKRASVTDGERRFECMNGCEVILRAHDDPILAPPIEDGPTVREVIWGVERAEDLESIAGALSPYPHTLHLDGSITCIDPNGMAVRFRVSKKRMVEVESAAMNTWSERARVDAPAPIYDRAVPIEVGHVVFFTPDVAAVSAFYEQIGFCLSDEYPGRGRFLRCAERGGHHDLFLLQTPEGRRGVNHIAFTVRDIHEVFGGGLHMSRCGWSTQLGPGRHPISSAYFWYFHNPAGGLIEYYTDEDFLTENWVPRSIEPSPERFAEWAISGGLDGHSRRQTGIGQTSKFLTE